MDSAEIVYVAGAVLLLFALVYFVVRNEIVRRRLVCPRTGGVAEVEIVRRYEYPGREIRVRSCSLFADPRRVECEGDCLRH